MLGGILGYVGLAASGRSPKALPVVHAGSPSPLATAVSLASQTGAQPRRHRVTLSWRAGQLTGASVEDLISGYNVYRRDMTSSKYFRINDDLLSDTTYVDELVRPGEIYEYETTAVNYRGTESGPSNRVTVKIPYP